MSDLPYLQEYRDQTGKLRRYVRRRGMPLVPLDGKKGSRKFLAQYHAAVSGTELPPQKATGLIYFADDGHFIKIGFSKDAVAREVQLQVGSSRPVQVIGTRPGTMRDERGLHRQFAHLRQRGEWFRKDETLLAFIGANTLNSWSDA